MLPYQLINT